jgi:hypothetical protein
MGRFSSGVKFGTLFFIFFLLFLVVRVTAVNLPQQDTGKTKRKDLPKVQIRDTTRPTADSGKSLVKNAGQVPVADSGKFQSSDTNKLKGADSLGTGEVQQIPDSVIYKQTTFEREELIRGERLFSGLVYFGNASINCTSCHNIREIDTLNWNPDAWEISKKYLRKNAHDLSVVLLKPAGAKMKVAHKDFILTAKDIVQIKGFMDSFAETGLQKRKPVITYLLLLIIASVIFLICFIDVIIKRIFKNSKINWAIITVTGIFITYILAYNAIKFGRYDGFAPAQPIKFSHKVHAGQNKTDCNYCHYTAKISKSAGIPPGNVCLNCHFLVRNGTRSGGAEISKVLGNLDQKIPVEWVRIYRLPDFVFFSHEQHVSAGQLNCEACHGNVKEMDRLYQVPDLSMGWCIKCHETRKVNFSNEYYKKYYPRLLESLMNGKVDSIRVAGIGGKDCGKCHY